MRTLIMAALAAAQPAGGGSRTHDFCDDVRLAVAAARAEPPFSTLPSRVFQQGHMLFGIAWPCQLEAAPRALRCTQYVTRARQAETIAAETARCLPGARRDPDESGEGSLREHRLTFPYFRARLRLPGVTIEISRGGSPANHLGQFVTYRVVLNPSG